MMQELTNEGSSNVVSEECEGAVVDAVGFHRGAGQEKENIYRCSRAGAAQRIVRWRVEISLSGIVNRVSGEEEELNEAVDG